VKGSRLKGKRTGWGGQGPAQGAALRREGGARIEDGGGRMAKAGPALLQE